MTRRFPDNPDGIVLGAVILAGGRGDRMGGVDKGGLALSGKSFLERITGQLSPFGEVLLSVDNDLRHPDSGLARVVDKWPGRGPMGGIVSALDACRSDALLAVSVDMPLFERGVGEYLRAFFARDCDAVVVRDRGGRVHPLCGIYGKTARAIMHDQLASGNGRMTDVLARLRTRYAPLAHSAYPDAAVTNVNTPEEYAALRLRTDGPTLVAVSGVKNSGKTTLLARLIPFLKRSGLRVGAIKHDGHDFVPDVPGADSRRLREAGAERVAVYSDLRYAVFGEWNRGGLEALLPAFAELDLVLVEGAKHSPLPKVEVVRRANSSAPVCDPVTLLAVCTDGDATPPGVPVYGIDDYEGVGRVILEWSARHA